MAFTGHLAWYTSSGKYDAVTAWAANTAYNVGDVRRPTNASSTYTVTVANPGVFTWKDNSGAALNHNFAAGDIVVFSGGSAPGGFTNGTNYFVVSGGLTATAFELAATPAGTAIQCTGAPAGNTANGVHVGNERVHVCIAAGTSAATLEPVWATTRGVKTTDNTVTWQEITGIPALNGDKTNTPNWTNGAKNTAITLGHVIQSGDATKILICTTAGTSGNGAEPSWSGSLGGTTADNTVTWTTIKISSNNFANWAAPHRRLRNATNTNWGGTIGLKHFVGNSHSTIDVSNFGPISVQLGTFANPAMFLCVNEAGSVPPVSADLTGGANEATAGVQTCEVSICGYVYGLSFEMQATSGNVDMKFGVAATAFEMLCDNCVFKYTGNNSAGGFNMGTGAGRKKFRDCAFVFGNAAQSIALGDLQEFENCTFAATGVAPTTLFKITPGTGVSQDSFTHILGGDMSNITGTIFSYYVNRQTTFYMDGVKLNSAVTVMANPATAPTRNRGYGVFSRSGASASDTVRMGAVETSGAVNPELTCVRTGGAQDNGTKYAIKMATTSNGLGTQAGFGLTSLRSNMFGVYNRSVATDLTATLHGIIFAAALPSNTDLYAEAWYHGASGNPQLTRKTSRIADALASGATLTADTGANWDGVAAARQNSHAYSVGDFIKTATCPGMIFLCTASSGNSAASEPGAFTGCADGAAITDGSVTWRACNRFKVAISLTSPQVQLVGVISARWFACTASQTYYIDPYIEIS